MPRRMACVVTLLCKWQLRTTKDQRVFHQRSFGTTSMWPSSHIMEKTAARGRGSRSSFTVNLLRNEIFSWVPSKFFARGLFDDALLPQLTSFDIPCFERASVFTSFSVLLKCQDCPACSLVCPPGVSAWCLSLKKILRSRITENTSHARR